MADLVNMSLDDIIRQSKQNRVSRSRGRGNGSPRGRGIGRGGRGIERGGRGRGRGRGGGGRGGRGRGRPQSRSGTPDARQGRSRSRGPRGRSQSRSRSQSQARSRSQSQGRSRSRQQRRSASRARSASRSRSRLRGLTPKGRAGLEEQQDMPSLLRTNRFYRGGPQNRLRRSNSNPNLQGSVHSRLGVTTRRGAANLRRPLAVAKRGISKRGRGFSVGNRYSNVGLRSDQILKEQRQNMLMQNNMIRSQTFRRSRNNSFSSSQLTVSVANDFAPKRRNSFGNAGYLSRQSLAQLTNQFGGYNMRRGPGSVKSVGSNRSNRSNRSTFSNQSNGSKRSNRSRGRGRGRGGNRGIGRKFVNKQILNPKLQKEIAAIQGKTYGTETPSDAPDGVNFSPTPVSTGQTLHQRFASK